MSAELQSSGQNPEWEADKGKNISFARRIENILTNTPDYISQGQEGVRRHIENLEELQRDDMIESARERGFTKDRMPGFIKYILRRSEVTTEPHGSTEILKHVYDKRYINLGVALDGEYTNYDTDSSHFNMDLIPQDFNYPIYIASRQASSLPSDQIDLEASTVHGKFKNNIVEVSGVYYWIHNLYCFNMDGQGLKIESIAGLGPLDDWLFGDEEKEMAKDYFPKLDYTLSDEDSRVVSLGYEDYEEVGKMFDEIDAGLYKR